MRSAYRSMTCDNDASLVDSATSDRHNARMKSLLNIVRKKINSGAVSVTEIARECGCSREYVYKLLREDSQPTIGIAEKLAAAVGAEITVKMKKRKKIVK